MKQYPNLKPWKPGQSGNVAGRAGTLPPEIRAARKQNQAKLIKLVADLFSLPASEVKKRPTQDVTQLEVAVQATINQAKSGDVPAFKYLMELMTGKIPEHDYDGFTEEDIAILNRVKELIVEQKRITEPPDSDPSH